jgi:hypothetical protein
MFSIDVFLQGQREPFSSLNYMDLVDTTTMEHVEAIMERFLGPKLNYDTRRTFQMNWPGGLAERRKFLSVKKEKEGCEEYLKQNMRFSCVVVDVNRKCAGSLFHPSTCKPVSVKVTRIRVSREVEVVFETFIPAPVGFYTEMVKCEVKITCGWKEGDEEKFYMYAIDFTMDDMNGEQLTWKDGNLIISNAIENGKRKINK